MSVTGSPCPRLRALLLLVNKRANEQRIHPGCSIRLCNDFLNSERRPCQRQYLPSSMRVSSREWFGSSPKHSRLHHLTQQRLWRALQGPWKELQSTQWREVHPKTGLAYNNSSERRDGSAREDCGTCTRCPQLTWPCCWISSIADDSNRFMGTCDVALC